MLGFKFFKRLSLSFFAVFFAMSINAHAANFKNLSFVGGYPELHPTVVNVFLPFMEKTAKHFDGKLSFNYFANNTLYPQSEAYAALQDGRTDFGVFRSAWSPGVVDVLGIVDLPGMASNGVVGSLLAQDLIEKFPEIAAEFPKDSFSFTTWASAPMQIHSLEPIKTLDDIKGKKVIVWDAVSIEIVKALGGNPIRINATDTYLSMSKGMADAVLGPLAPIRSFKISDITEHHTELNLGVGTFNVNVFGPLWDEFPPEYQEYLKEEGKKMALDAGKSLEIGASSDKVWMQSLGHHFYEVSEADRAKMLEAFQPFKQTWIEKVKAKGITNAEEILKYAEERSAYYQAEFEKGTYGSTETIK